MQRERYGKEQQIFEPLYVEVISTMLSKEETTFFFAIINNAFSALSSVILLLQCKIFVDVLARIADSANPLIGILKMIAKYFFQVTHPSSWRMYGLLILEAKMHLISEYELSLVFLLPCHFSPGACQDLSSRLTMCLGLSTHQSSVLLIDELVGSVESALPGCPT